ncbi:MAG: Crp/Fnr family transcriptional regulator [Bdellovibrio sp.]|nr:Crp/Fnr family transcriptional regulator [Bdellovibrio sp.]
MKSHRRPPIEIIIARKELCDFLQNHHQKQLFKSSTEIIYQGHVPTAAYVLLKGEIEIYKGKRRIETLRGPNIIIAANELVHDLAYPYSIAIKSLSETYILCRSSIKEIMAAGFLPQLQTNSDSA